MPSNKAASRATSRSSNKKTPSTSGTKVSPQSDPGSSLPFELQQKLLDIFRLASAEIQNDNLSQKIQQVKQHLFNREFLAAFQSPLNREAYTARWSPTRALAYADIFYGLPLFSDKHSAGQPFHHKVVCLGAGGGAELVALAGCSQNRQLQAKSESLSGNLRETPNVKIECTCVDGADWSMNLRRIHSILTTPPPISPYASNEMRLNNRELIDSSELTFKYLQHDLMQPFNPDHENSIREAELVTMMFTLNELYSTSIGSTTKLLLSLTASMQRGAILLVVDSPGSYSTINVGGTAKLSEESSPPNKDKQYPMHWLLDHTLLNQANAVSARPSSIPSSSPSSNMQKQWEKLDSQDSKWCRLHRNLKYPLPLEDMRYQLRTFRKL